MMLPSCSLHTKEPPISEVKISLIDPKTVMNSPGTKMNAASWITVRMIAIG